MLGFRGLRTLRRFSDGQSNPTYKLSDTSGSSYVLRAKPPGNLLKSAHAVDREFRVMTALAKTAVPVPKMLHLSGDDSPMGSTVFGDGLSVWHRILGSGPARVLQEFPHQGL